MGVSPLRQLEVNVGMVTCRNGERTPPQDSRGTGVKFVLMPGSGRDRIENQQEWAGAGIIPDQFIKSQK